MRSRRFAFLVILLCTSAAARAFAAANLTPLGDLPGGVIDSRAHGVSGDGSVVVGSSGVSASYPSRTLYEAFRWTSGGGMVGLGALPGANTGEAAASGDGSVVVGFSAINNETAPQAFRWTSGGGMVGLGHLPGGIRSAANGVSGDGLIVVGYSAFEPGLGAFYWTADGGMRALWNLLLSHGVDPAADGWTELSSARGISADGNAIVGYGQRNGITEAFVAVIPTIVPEPAAGALALLGVSSILLLRRRSLWRPNKFSLSKDEPCD